MWGSHRSPGGPPSEIAGSAASAPSLRPHLHPWRPAGGLPRICLHGPKVGRAAPRSISMPVPPTVRSRFGALPWTPAFLLVGLGSLLIVLSGLFAERAAAAPCDPPIANQIVCENSKPGDPASEWDVSGSGDPTIQGFATDISVDQGADRPLQGRHRLDRLSPRHLPDGLLRRRRCTARWRPSSPRRPCPRISRPASTRPRPGWSTAATGPCRPPGRSRPTPSPASTSPSWCATTPLGGSHIVFIVRDDDGHSDLLFQTSDTTWQAYNRYGGNSLYTGSSAAAATRLQGQLQPPLHDPRRHAEDCSLQRRVPDGPLARSETATTSATSPASTPIAVERRSSSTRPSSRSATTSTGPGDSGPTSRRPGTPASTSPSSAATRSSGRPAGRTASTARTPPPHPGLLQGDPRQREDRPDPLPGPAPGAIRASARPPTAAARKTRSPAPSSPSTRAPRRSRSRPPTARCASGATPRSPTWRPNQTATLATTPWATNGTRISTTASAPPG